MNQGGICIGCTMPGFPDKFSPFYKQAPGAWVSTRAVPAYKEIIRFLRGLTQNHQNREAHWDRVEDVSSGWALEKAKDHLFSKLADFFYRKMQFAGSVRPGRTVAETKYRDGWEVKNLRQQTEKEKEFQGEMKWGYARRRAKLEREEKSSAVSSQLSAEHEGTGSSATADR
jgi:hypothetical protein